MACLIDAGSLLDCDNLPVGGVNDYVLLYNYSEWRAMEEAGNITRDVDGVITGITNSSGVQAFQFDVPDSTALVLGYPVRLVDGGVDGFDHTVNFSILDTKQPQKEQMENMRFENVVAIVLKKNGYGEVYGDSQGLELQNNTANPNDAALGAVIPIELLTSPRTAPEPKAPVDIFITDAATTRALIEGLTTPGA